MSEPISIPCPGCGRPRDFSHLPGQVTDWQELVPVLEAEPCLACRLRGTRVVCLLTRPEPKERRRR